jgi:hypothetical protein
VRAAQGARAGAGERLALAMVRPRGQALATLRQSGAERLLPFEEVAG